MNKSKKGNKINHPNVSRGLYCLKDEEKFLMNSTVFKVLLFYVSGEATKYKDINYETKKRLNKKYALNNFSKTRELLSNLGILKDVTPNNSENGTPKKEFKLIYEKLLYHFMKPMFSINYSTYDSLTPFFDELDIGSIDKDKRVKAILVNILKQFMIIFQKIVYRDICREVNQDARNVKANVYTNFPNTNYEKDYWNLYDENYNGYKPNMVKDEIKKWKRLNTKLLLIDSNILNLNLVIDMFYEFLLTSDAQKLIKKNIKEKFPNEEGKEVWDDELGHQVFEHIERESAELFFDSLESQIRLYFIKDIKHVISTGVAYYFNKKN